MRLAVGLRGKVPRGTRLKAAHRIHSPYPRSDTYWVHLGDIVDYLLTWSAVAADQFFEVNMSFSLTTVSSCGQTIINVTLQVTALLHWRVPTFHGHFLPAIFNSVVPAPVGDSLRWWLRFVKRQKECVSETASEDCTSTTSKRPRGPSRDGEAVSQSGPDDYYGHERSKTTAAISSGTGTIGRPSILLNFERDRRGRIEDAQELEEAQWNTVIAVDATGRKTR